ncbi:putative Zf-FLZ domain-containing protein [Helianthus annuus]|nr:putative Zf-FLZ domain-containing protein [Helianthus annuus]
MNLVNLTSSIFLMTLGYSYELIRGSGRPIINQTSHVVVHDIPPLLIFFTCGLQHASYVSRVNFEEQQPHFLDACFLCKKPLGQQRHLHVQVKLSAFDFLLLTELI